MLYQSKMNEMKRMKNTSTNLKQLSCMTFESTFWASFWPNKVAQLAKKLPYPVPSRLSYLVFFTHRCLISYKVLLIIEFTIEIVFWIILSLWFSPTSKLPRRWSWCSCWAFHRFVASLACLDLCRSTFRPRSSLDWWDITWSRPSWLGLRMHSTLQLPMTEDKTCLGRQFYGDEKNFNN